MYGRKLKPTALECSQWLPLVLLFASFAAGQAPDPAIISELRQKVPSSGAVFCSMQRAEDGDFEAYGYDFATGYWYEYRFGTGRANLGREGLFVTGGTDHTRQLLGTSSRNYYIEQRIFPFIWIRHILDQPARIRRLEKSGTGYLIEYDEGGDGERVCELVLDESGRVTTCSRKAVQYQHTYRYIGNAGALHPIACPSFGTWTLLSARFEPNGVRFTQAGIEKILTDYRVAISEGKLAKAKSAPDSGDIAVRPSVDGVRTARVSVSERPFFIAGAVLVAIGAVLWWRRH